MAVSANAAAKVHHLALQISDDTPDKMNAVLNVAANTARYHAASARRSRSASSPSMPASTCCAPTARRCWRA